MMTSANGLHFRCASLGGNVLLQQVVLAGFGLVLAKGLLWLAASITLQPALTA
jgi:hypothetical protein